MARVNMEAVVEDLDEQFAKVLKAVVDEIAPENNKEPREIMRIFRMRLERGFGRWETVKDTSVDAGY